MSFIIHKLGRMLDEIKGNNMKTLDQKLKALSRARRGKVEKRAAELIAEESERQKTGARRMKPRKGSPRSKTGGTSAQTSRAADSDLLDSLVSEITPENRHSEISLGSEVGKEMVEWSPQGSRRSRKRGGSEH